jgi:hypothetical protein
VELRYRFRVDANAAQPPGVGPTWKILFTFHRFSGWGGGWETESNLYSFRRVYQPDGTCLPAGYDLAAEAAMDFSIQDTLPPDPLGRRIFGVRTLDPTFFPEETRLIDGIADLWKHLHWSQADLNGREGTVLVERVGSTTEAANLSCLGALAPDTRYLWRQTLTLEDDVPHRVEFALPESRGTYLSPTRPTGPYTEAFYLNYGLFRVYLWDVEVRAEGSAAWTPLTRWKIDRTDIDPNENTWGYRLANLRGVPAIEVSNDRSPTYLRPGETLDTSTVPVCTPAPMPRCTQPSKAKLDIRTAARPEQRKA